MNASAFTREGITTDTAKVGMNTAYPIEHSARNASGEDSVRTGTVKDKIGWLRGSDLRRFEGCVSVPAVKVQDADEPCGRESDRYIFGNPLRGWVYALLPSLVIWAIVIGMIHRLVKR